jgi:hypothetical protein
MRPAATGNQIRHAIHFGALVVEIFERISPSVFKTRLRQLDCHPPPHPVSPARAPSSMSENAVSSVFRADVRILLEPVRTSGGRIARIG